MQGGRGRQYCIVSDDTRTKTKNNVPKIESTIKHAAHACMQSYISITEKQIKRRNIPYVVCSISVESQYWVVPVSASVYFRVSDHYENSSRSREHSEQI